MRFGYKLLAGLHMLRLTPGLGAKAATLRQLVRVALASKPPATPAVSDQVATQAWSDFHLLSFVNRPVNVRLVTDRPPRLMAILPELNPSVIFGGYIALFQFLAFLQRRGVRVEVLVLKPLATGIAPAAMFANNPRVRDVLAQATVHAMGVGRTVCIGTGDAVLCYNWTTALVAAKIAAAQGAAGYTYFVQEDERVFYPSDSHRFLAESIFHAEPRPNLICNSAKLAEALRRDGLTGPQTEIAVFEQGIPDAPLPTRADLAARDVRRFVFYGRPEDHARRNLMTIAMMALAQAVRDGAFAGARWEFYMIGSMQMGAQFSVGGINVTALPNTGYDAYRAGLLQFDAGMALMSAPHPSVPPFEMVRSGIVTVVNTMPARPADWYRAISGNFEPAAATVEGLAQAISRATARVGDVDARLAAARSYHPADWEDAFAAMAGKLSHPLFAAALMPMPVAQRLPHGTADAPAGPVAMAPSRTRARR